MGQKENNNPSILKVFYDLWYVMYGAVIQDNDGSLSNPINKASSDEVNTLQLT